METFKERRTVARTTQLALIRLKEVIKMRPIAQQCL